VRLVLLVVADASERTAAGQERAGGITATRAYWLTGVTRGGMPRKLGHWKTGPLFGAVAVLVIGSGVCIA